MWHSLGYTVDRWFWKLGQHLRSSTVLTRFSDLPRWKPNATDKDLSLFKARVPARNSLTVADISSALSMFRSIFFLMSSLQTLTALCCNSEYVNHIFIHVLSLSLCLSDESSCGGGGGHWLIIYVSALISHDERRRLSPPPPPPSLSSSSSSSSSSLSSSIAVASEACLTGLVLLWT